MGSEALVHSQSTLLRCLRGTGKSESITNEKGRLEEIDHTAADASELTTEDEDQGPQHSPLSTASSPNSVLLTTSVASQTPIGSTLWVDLEGGHRVQNIANLVSMAKSYNSRSPPSEGDKDIHTDNPLANDLNFITQGPGIHRFSLPRLHNYPTIPHTLTKSCQNAPRVTDNHHVSVLVALSPILGCNVTRFITPILINTIDCPFVAYSNQSCVP